MTMARSSAPATANSGAKAAPRLRVHTPSASTLFLICGSPKASTYAPAVTTHVEDQLRQRGEAARRADEALAVDDHAQPSMTTVASR